MTSLLAGCQNQHYLIMCKPQYSGRTCDLSDLSDLSDLDARGCSSAKATVRTCSSFVDSEVRRQLALKRGQTNAPVPYRNSSSEVVRLGSYASGGGMLFVYLNSSTPQAYSQSAYEAKSMVNSRLSLLKFATSRYVSEVVNGNPKTSEGEVLAAIASLRSLEAPLKRMIDDGEHMLDFYSSQPSVDYEVMAHEVVRKTNDRDPYLRAGAEMAIGESKRYESNSPKVRVKEAVENFEALHALAIAPYSERFTELKKRASVQARVAAKAAEHRRAQQRAFEREQRQGGGFEGSGGCSCAGGNVCYGPRGGRYCITSGGKKRYGI
ncbi:hypothetical protein [Pseudomonas putida]|uniref:hypothetical protein n=1 Tax=Pseudomonas putida TaxID=303 RepID=UPI003F88FDFD